MAAVGADGGEVVAAPAVTAAVAVAAPLEVAKAGPPRPSAVFDLAGALAAAVAGVEAATGARLGVALLAAGGDPASVVSAGSWVSGRAWSTIKAPIAVAALAAGGSDDAAVLAITQSDNAAARQLWNSIGARETSAAATQAVLRQGGDGATIVTQAPFGHTEWTLAAQAVFAAQFPTGASADRVWELMGQVEPSQRWGLGRFDGAHFKGGWSPDQGGYVVRQFGQVATAAGCVAVAVGGAASGFEAGTAALDALVDRLAALADHLPAGACR
jgi:hypothetical protein